MAHQLFVGISFVMMILASIGVGISSDVDVEPFKSLTQIANIILVSQGVVNIILFILFKTKVLRKTVKRVITLYVLNFIGFAACFGIYTGVMFQTTELQKNKISEDVFNLFIFLYIGSLASMISTITIGFGAYLGVRSQSDAVGNL